MQAKKMIEYVPDPDKFDLVTHRWDQSGNLIYKNLYRKFIIDRNEYYERPVNSGNLWYENNQPAGRVEYKVNEKGHIFDKVFNHSAEHKAYTAPASPQELGEQLLSSQAENNRLKSELAAILKEREAKQPKVVEKAEHKSAPTLSRRE